MAESLEKQMEKLRLSIEGLEAQRGALGEAVIAPALQALRKQLVELEEQAAAQAAPAEERRMVTILFVDMVGSTSMAEKLDPEEWRQIISKLHTSLGEAITAHRGTIAQYLGDGLLAFFGAREASEHDPEYAIRAALDGQAIVTSQLAEENVQLRAGIHTGLVVVGELGEASHKEFTASGDAMNLAARLQSSAPPGGILISHDTYRYVRGVFDFTPRPPLMVKGKSEPIQTYLVRRAKPRPFRSVARGVAGVETRTVGRDAETQALQEAYLRAYTGHGVVWVQLVSELGVGKSRLLGDMSEWIDLREETVRLLRARAFPDDANQPYALVRRMWFERFQISDDIPLAQAEARWVERFKELLGREDCEEEAHALGLLVGLPFASSPHIKAMREDPTQVKGRALVVSRELLQAVRQDYPVVLLLEDLQWTDTASWEYLVEAFLEEAGGDHANGLFVLGAARPEWQPPQKLAGLFEASASGERVDLVWGSLIWLNPLSDQATRELVYELLQRAAEIPEQVVDLLVERSEGVPYFTEEMVNWMLDHDILDNSGDPWRVHLDRLKEQPLPATLQHLLLTRLSSLSPVERAALQRGAIFGRRFWTRGLEALGVPAGEELLGRLQPRGFVEAQPDSVFQDDTEWSFHQNLLQEVTYESVLKRERAALHKVAAGWLERQAGQAGRLDEFAGLLGDHYERAGDLSAAADWYLRAAKRAMAQGAPREARRFYTQALDLLPPVDRDRRWQALFGREATLEVLGDAGAQKADIDALLELAHAIGDDHRLAEASFRQALCVGLAGDLPLAMQAGQQAIDAAQRCGDEAIEIKSLALMAIAELFRGQREAAREKVETALRRARALGDDNVLAYVLFRASFFYGELGVDIPLHSVKIALQEEQIELDHRLGNRLQEATGLGNLGASYQAFGLFKQARTLIEQAAGIARAIGARRSLAFDELNLGEICLTSGDLRTARHWAELALQDIVPTGDVRGTIFALNILGWVILAMDDAPGAWRRFAEACDLASRHEYPFLVCEVNTGLAACAVRQGQLDEARKYALEAFNHLKALGWTGISNPCRVYYACAESFDALGDLENYRAAVEIGYQAIMQVADKTDDPAWRQSFLENVPENRRIVEMWERLQA